MYRAALLLVLLPLAACSTPFEQCLRDAEAPYRSALKERERIARDLERGYIYETKYETVRKFNYCRPEKGEYSAFPCWEDDTQPVTRQVPVDAEALRRRDTELARVLPGLRARAEEAASECRTTYPAEPAKPS